MNIVINKSSKERTRDQVVRQVRAAVASGELVGSDRLPSAADVAWEQGVAKAAIQIAYQDLMLMGILERYHGDGPLVCLGCEDECRDRYRAEIVARLCEVVAEAEAAGMTVDEILVEAQQS